MCSTESSRVSALCSIRDLESEPGLFLSDKQVRTLPLWLFSFTCYMCQVANAQGSHILHCLWFLQKVFAEAEEMAKGWTALHQYVADVDVLGEPS